MPLCNQHVVGEAAASHSVELRLKRPARKLAEPTHSNMSGWTPWQWQSGQSSWRGSRWGQEGAGDDWTGSTWTSSAATTRPDRSSRAEAPERAPQTKCIPGSEGPQGVDKVVVVCPFGRHEIPKDGQNGLHNILQVAEQLGVAMQGPRDRNPSRGGGKGRPYCLTLEGDNWMVVFRMVKRAAEEAGLDTSRMHTEEMLWDATADGAGDEKWPDLFDRYDFKADSEGEEARENDPAETRRREGGSGGDGEDRPGEGSGGDGEDVRFTLIAPALPSMLPPMHLPYTPQQ